MLELKRLPRDMLVESAGVESYRNRSNKCIPVRSKLSGYLVSVEPFEDNIISPQSSKPMNQFPLKQLQVATHL
jgi:hypothetical protein